jgi:hypothetical protein
MDRASVEASYSGLPGSFEWIDDSTLTYAPGEAPPPDSGFELTFGTRARAANGMALVEPVTLSYRTVGALRLSQALPEGGATAVDPSSAVVAALTAP